MVFAALAQAGTNLQLFEAVEPHMGTLVRIKLYAQDAIQAKQAFRAAFHRIGDLDGILSDYKPDSELNRICLAAIARPVEVSTDLFRVLTASQKLAEESGGAFDVTLGPVIRLWRDARTEHHLPDPAVLRDTARLTGYRKLHLDAVRQTVMLDSAGMRLDVGGIGKGYAADAALEAIAALGIRSALVAVSGDLAFSDAPPGRRGWKIGIGSTGRVMELRNQAVSTSGDSEQHLDVAGKRYSHIIDPATHAGLTSGITVTIIAPRGIDADGLSTAISVLGPERGMKLLKKHPGTSMFIDGGECPQMRRYPQRDGSCPNSCGHAG